MRRHLRRPLTALLVASLVLAACGDDDDDTATGDTSTTSTTADDTTSSSTTTETTEPGELPGELPGERVDIFPYEGAELAVVGVEDDDVLNVRAGPSVDFDVVAELAPLATGVVATGHNRSVDDSFWVEVEAEGETGWANVSFLSQLGTVDDITSEFDDRPGAETMLDLGMLVAERRAGDGPPEQRIVVVDGPTVGDLGEITVDVLDFPDDAQLGERLHIFGEPGVESFTLRSVERTVLCRRGVSEDGLCV